MKNFVTGSSPGKIDSLESLRGIAAFVVLLSHLVFAFWPDLKSGTGFPLSELWHNGEFAVRLFFVLSGFVLSLTFFKCQDTQVLSAAAARRYFRLYIPAATSILFAYLLHVNGAFEPLRRMEQFSGVSAWLQHFYAGPPSFKLAIREAFAGAILDYQYLKYNEVLWTMEVELKGSLLVFATLALFGKARQRWLIYGTLIYSLDCLQMQYALDFACGMALCDWHSLHPNQGRHSWLWIAIFILGCCLGDLHRGWVEAIGMADLTRGNRWWPTLAAACLVASSARSSRIQRVLAARPLVLLGKCSFALYLFHLPIICSLGAWTYISLANQEVSHGISAAVTSLICITASLLIAQIGPQCLDPFAIRIGRLAEQQLFPACDAVQLQSGSGKRIPTKGAFGVRNLPS